MENEIENIKKVEANKQIEDVMLMEAAKCTRGMMYQLILLKIDINIKIYWYIVLYFRFLVFNCSYLRTLERYLQTKKSRIPTNSIFVKNMIKKYKKVMNLATGLKPLFQNHLHPILTSLTLTRAKKLASS